MDVTYWIAFTVASAVMLAIPGPTILLVVSYALGHGRRATGATVAGVALGDFVAMTASMAGLGALLATSAALFSVLKWIGAAYLVYLGVKLWRAGGGTVDPADDGPADGRSRRIFLHAFAVTALNPKSIVFFVAFLPQFLDPAAPFLLQMAVFEVTFLVLAAVNAFAWATMASAARRTIRRPSVQRTVNRIGGSMLMGAGAAAALWRGSPA